MRNYFFTIGISGFIVAMLIAQPIKASERSEREYDHKRVETRILFLCTGNSCRSQIAEGWTRHLGKESVQVKSAGIEAHGINPRTIRVMEESGIDITGQTSKVVALDMIQWANLVVTVCGDADERCPLLPYGTIKIHWSLPDPAKATGSDEEIMSEFRSVSNEIHQLVIGLLGKRKEGKK